MQNAKYEKKMAEQNKPMTREQMRKKRRKGKKRCHQRKKKKII